jgi:DNA-binding XRE family transcriptional regulator
MAMFLKQQRGQATFAAFAKKLGVARSTLHRLENGDQSATLEMVSQIIDRLKVKPSDIFRD